MLKQTFIAQAVQCGCPSEKADDLWLEIETAYLEPDRHFHGLIHIEQVLQELLPLQTAFKDWPTAFFSIIYHDVVYNVAQNTVMNDNEERSAEFAARQLRSFHYPESKIERCQEQIMATKKHGFVTDNDTNLFTDADLSILGKPWSIYSTYKNNVRKEFAIYPDGIYTTGRRKVLEYFLLMNPLFKTEHFRQRYETSAKENMKREISLLQG